MEKTDTLSRLKEKERALRQKLIIEAAREVFGEKTYDSVSMAEIARTAGIAKSSIYTYFKSQEELYVEIAFRDTRDFIAGLTASIQSEDRNILSTVINHFLDYYICNEAQWRMITHFALHGNRNRGTVEKLNLIGRSLMDLFDAVFLKLGKPANGRLLSHTLFSALSGILIAYRKYPGRSEADRIAHMKAIGSTLELMILAYLDNESGSRTALPG